MRRIRGLPGNRWVVDGVMLLAVLLPVLLASEVTPDYRLSLTALRIVAVPVVAVAVLAARRLPAVAASAPAVLSILAADTLYTAQLSFAGILLAYLLGRRTAGRRAVALLIACLGAIALAQLTWLGSTARDWFELGSTALLVVVLPWTVGQLVHQQARLIQAGWDLAERLEREQDRVADQVRLRERARIATDMHDSLGHELSLIAVRAAALQIDARTSGEGRQAAGELRQAAADATERLREIIGMLRDDGDAAPVLPADDSVAELVRRASASGMDVTLDDAVGERPSDPPIPDATARAARRVVQEALTNAAKHALGQTVRVSVRQDADHLLVTVVNNLPQAASDAPRGYGLIGLDERVRLVGGRLDAGPLEGEFMVRARLPVRASVTPTPPSNILRSRHAEADARCDLLRGLIGTFWPPAVIVVFLVLLYLANRGWN